MNSGNEAVVSGIGGFFPKTVDLEDFKQLLLENVTTVDDPRWGKNELDHYNKTNNMDNIHEVSFDTTFFSIHRGQALYLDAMTRMFLEKTFEAIIDAGMNPSELRGKNIPVMIGSCLSEFDRFMYEAVKSGLGITGQARCMISNRVSYWLNVNGSSFTTDANWSSGVHVIRNAIELIKSGSCDGAIIGCANYHKHSIISKMMSVHGLLSKEECTRPFDEKADGYTRGDGIVVLFVQRADLAKRNYATLLHADLMFNGSSDNHYTEKNQECFTKFLKQSYKDSGINPNNIDYLETYGCGIKEVDKLEMEAVEEVFCKNREKPLKIGSVKTNIGHTETVSDIMSLIKIIVAMETGIIPAHINYDEPNANIPALKNKNIEIVTKNTKWNPGLAAINSMGLTSSYGHIIIKSNPKTRKIIGQNNNFPALLTFSTRTEEGINEIIEHIKLQPDDIEFNHLVREAYSKYVPGHIYRGYVLKCTEDTSAFEHFAGDKKPVWFVYSGMGSQWQTMGKELMQLELFEKAVNKCHELLLPKGIDLINIITDDDPTIFENILNSFVGIAAVQIGLTDCLQAIGITPDGVIGHSVGELGCAYADGVLTAEQMILSAYYRGKASLDADLIPGVMAAIGMSYRRLKPFCPKTIDIACHNSHESCTISGPAPEVEAFVNVLKSKNVFAKLVNVSNIAYHSRYIRPAAPYLLEYLKKVITNPKKISSKWVSTSIPESEWNTSLAATGSAEYFTNNLLSSVLLEETLPHIPNNAITIEIAPHGILQAILKRALAPEIINIALTKRNKNCLEYLLNSLGQLYLTGLDLNINVLYPHVPYPVSVGTNSLCKLIKWEHGDEWNAYSEQISLLYEKQHEINMNSKEYDYLNNHKVDGQIILPPALYFTLMCETLEKRAELKYVTFENLVFRNQIVAIAESTVNIRIMINEGTKLFEVTHLDKIILSGRVIINKKYNVPLIEEAEKDDKYTINTDDFYTELNTRGYHYSNAYKCVKNINFNSNGFSGKIQCNNKNWTEVFSAMLQLHLYYSSDSRLDALVPKFIQSLSLSFEKFHQNTMGNECSAEYDIKTGAFNSNIGIYMQSPFHSVLKHTPKKMSVENHKFMNYINDESIENIQQGFDMFMKLITENTINNDIIITELNNTQINSCIKYVEKYFQHSFKSNYEIINKLRDDTNLLIVYDEIITDEHLKNNRFVLLQTQQPPNSTSDSVVIAKFNNSNYSFYLLRKPNKSPVKLLTVDKSSTSWKQELKLMSNNLKCRLLIASRFMPEEGIDKFVEETQNIVPDNRNLRLLFDLKSSLPDDISKYDKGFLDKDLFAAVLKNDNLGNYIRTVTTDTTENVAHNSILATATSKDIMKFIIILYEFAKFYNANYLNLHLKDLTRSNDKTSPAEICAVDYVGVDSKTGRNIMGIARPNLKESKLIPDPDYVWEVPLTWNASDAATIPYAYTLAYYTLFEVANITKGDAVLIHAGCTAFGQAALHVAFNYGCDVYTTIATDHQKQILKKLLPGILEENIMSSEDSKFELQVLMQTKGRGVDVVLNCLPGELLHASKRCLATFGRFIQLGSTDFKNYIETGMSIFLKCTSFHSVNVEKIFECDAEVKRRLHQMISKDIKCGFVKPIARKIVSENRIDHILRNLKSSTVAETAIIKLHDLNTNISEKMKKSFVTFDENGVYLIYGDMRDSWLYLVEWLIKRGARKVLVAQQTDNHQNYINRYLSLLKRNYNAEILITQCNASTLANARRLLTTANPFKTIISGAFVFAGHDEKGIDKQLLKNIDSALKLENIVDCRMVCFVGQSNDEYIRSNGDICNVQWEKKYTIMDILKNLDSLLTMEDNLNITVKNEVVVRNEEKISKDDSLFLPNSLKTLKQIGENTSDEILVSLKTQTPNNVKGLAPVFIVPGLSGIHCHNFQEFVSQLLYPAYAVNIHGINLKVNDASKIAEFIVKSHKSKTYNLIGVSWGGILTIEIAKELEKLGEKVNVQIADGAPKTVQVFTSYFNKSEQFNMDLLKQMLKISDCQSLEDGLINPNDYLYKKDCNFIEKSLKSLRNLIEFSNFYKPETNKIIGQTILMRPENCDKEDLCNLTEHCIEVRYKTIYGNHRNFILDKKFIEYINDNHMNF